MPLCALACKYHADSRPARGAVRLKCRRVKGSDDGVDAFGDGDRVCCHPLRHYPPRVSHRIKHFVHAGRKGEVLLRTGNLLRR